ncbi:hypothetical protein NPIL_312441 [Nephila pilipes]|uniref:Uncharacterized protein n=1 Tax=Nephila pilipes TaxID=299642 RepID=A0A8X6NQ12_NEPPI|nr:hypothetical protein NPIL_312441 [Nephila pilipes]
MEQDEVAEWLRRWTANPLGSARRTTRPLQCVRRNAPKNVFCGILRSGIGNPPTSLAMFCRGRRKENYEYSTSTMGRNRSSVRKRVQRKEGKKRTHATRLEKLVKSSGIKSLEEKV